MSPRAFPHSIPDFSAHTGTWEPGSSSKTCSCLLLLPCELGLAGCLQLIPVSRYSGHKKQEPAARSLSEGPASRHLGGLLCLSVMVSDALEDLDVREPYCFKPKPLFGRRRGGQRRAPAYLGKPARGAAGPARDSEVGGGGPKVGASRK